jgi:hypothetical protein
VCSSDLASVHGVVVGAGFAAFESTEGFSCWVEALLSQNPIRKLHNFTVDFGFSVLKLFGTVRFTEKVNSKASSQNAFAKRWVRSVRRNHVDVGRVIHDELIVDFRNGSHGYTLPTYGSFMLARIRSNSACRTVKLGRPELELLKSPTLKFKPTALPPVR